MKDYCSYKNNMNLEKYKYFLKWSDFIMLSKKIDYGW
jgi:hypothetical protein